MRDPYGPMFTPPPLRAQRICIALAMIGLAIIAATCVYAFFFMRG